jgi:hypothetical protein
MGASMKTCLRFLPVLSLSLILLTCGNSKGKWQGAIEEIDGVTVVKNPLQPLYPEEVVAFKEDLSIESDEENQTYLFNELAHITVDRQNRIYALDRAESHVLVFDAEGRYLRTIGQKGQGPGELNVPTFIYITNNELMVLQIERISLFSLDGEFLRSVSTAKNWSPRARMNSRKQFIAATFLADEKNFIFNLELYDDKFQHLKQISRVSFERSRRANPFGPALYMTVMDDDRIVFGFSRDYTLDVFSPEGDPAFRIVKDYRPVEVTEDEKAAELAELPSDIQVDWPKYHCPYRRFVHDEQGRLYVQTMEKCSGFHAYVHDVFDRDGRFITRARLSQYPVVFHKGKLYSLVENEDGFKMIKRYKVTWKI